MNTGHRSAVIVYNPVKIDVDELRETVDNAASQHGWDSVEWVETAEDDPGYSQAKKAVDEGASMVVAAGGDGTVRLAASAIAGTDAALGIIPVGTGNLLARNVKLPLDIPQAIDAIFSGETVKMDICHADVTRENGDTERLDFVVMAGVGIDAQMIANTNDDLKATFGVLAYAAAIAQSLKGGNNVKTLIRRDGGAATSTRLHSLIIGNCGELVGNIALIPDARANDGVIDVATIRPSGMLGWLLIVGRIGRQMLAKVARKRGRVTGEDEDLDALRYTRAKEFSVELSEPEIFEVDGDDVGEVTKFDVSITHLGLNIRVTDEFAAGQEGDLGHPEADMERI